MSVKVIEKPEKKQVRCNYCKALLEYTSLDENITPTNYNRYDKYIICPKCMNRIYIVIH